MGSTLPAAGLFPQSLPGYNKAMQAHSTTVFYLVLWAVYLPAILWYVRRKRHSLAIAAFSAIVPSLVALDAGYVFVLNRGEAVRQFVAYSASGMDVWSHWASAWPMLLLLTLLAAAGHFVWGLVAGFRERYDVWVVVAVASGIMSLLALLVVVSAAPTA